LKLKHNVNSPFNPWPESKYESSSKDRIIKFAKIIEDAGK